MPHLLVGPLLRWAAGTEAVVWLEADRACEAEVLGARARTFAVEGHHVALVHVTGLEPGRPTPYEVRLDGERVWPPAPGQRGADLGPSVIRTVREDAGAVRIAFGTCRVTEPHEEPWTEHPDDHPDGRGPDALAGLAERVASAPAGARPDALLLLGDQVYADDVAPGTRARVRARRDTSAPPYEDLADFEEYTWLYQEAWSEPRVRWLLSTVPSAMVFDDHEVIDDWNISAAWRAQVQGRAWWQPRIEGALMAYWLYQHAGNLSPAEQAADPLLTLVRAHEGDAGALVREHARRADADPAAARWSHVRDIGRVRVVTIDTRAGRVLEEGARRMVDEHEWAWIARRAVTEDGARHVVLASSLPALGPHGVNHAEAWSEAVAGGAWGSRAARWAERLRQGYDLEHWPAFGRSFTALWRLVGEIAAGRRGPAPASVILVAGDVHYGSVSRVALPRAAGARCAVWQVISSPLRNPLPGRLRFAVRAAEWPAARLAWRLLARAAGVADPPVRWRVERPSPWFDNHVTTLRYDGDHVGLAVDRAEQRPGGHVALAPLCDRELR